MHVALAGSLRHCRGLVQKHLEQGAYQALGRLAPLDSTEGFEAARKRMNRRIVLELVPDVIVAASTALPVPLTSEQAEAIATDEDATLVLAGAGTGKTAVIVGKIAHLVRNQGVSPHEILVLAYNRKAADEIQARLPGDLSAAHVSTFHAFGRRVIAESGVAPTISKLAQDELAFRSAVDNILKEILNDPKQSHTVTNFITYHHAPYRFPFDFDTSAEYNEYVRSVELRTLNGVLIKSFEELEIANYLTEHDIKFRYEDQYEHRTATPERRQYQPDFYLPDYGIYIEHVALNQEGLPPPGWKGYAEDVGWKRSIHKQYGTKLIETYSWQRGQGTLLPRLREQLEQAGVRFERVPQQTLIRRLIGWLISWLAGLLATFLNHVKISGLTPDELRARSRAYSDRLRSEGFLSVFEKVRERYEGLLECEDALDFHDLINRAACLIREGRWETPYRYVLVDEFQDISHGRMELLKALRRQNVAYFLVGDDWQSIYRFSGSDVGLVRGCGAYLGHVRERALTQTFRFGDGILRPSTEFVQRNPGQTQRRLESATNAKDEGITVVADHDPANGLLCALQDIVATTRGKRHSVLVLGRYNFSKSALLPNARNMPLEVEFSTVHRAKGREANYVVVLDLKDGRRGFPSRSDDDPLLEIVLPPVSGKAYLSAEERRLFYVAMTRARVGTYLVTDPVWPSPFVTELLRQSPYLRRLREFARQCPRCNIGRLKKSQSQKTMRCSYYPICDHLTPLCPNCNVGYVVVTGHELESECTNSACDGPPMICPRCGMGVLILRQGPYGPFWGCSEYRDDLSCRYTQDADPWQ